MTEHSLGDWFRDSPETRRMLKEEEAKLADETAPIVIVDRVSALGIKPTTASTGRASACPAITRCGWGTRPSTSW